MRWAQMALQDQAQKRNDALQYQSMQDQNARFMASQQMDAARMGQQNQQFQANLGWQQKQQGDEFDFRRGQQEAGFEHQIGMSELNADLVAKQREADDKARFDYLMKANKAELTHAGALFQDKIGRQIDIIRDNQVNGLMTREQAQEAEQQIVMRAAGVDTGRLIQSDEDVAKSQAKLRAKLDATTILDERGNRLQLTPDGKWAPITTPRDPDTELQAKIQIGREKSWADAKVAHDKAQSQRPDPLVPAVPFMPFSQWNAQYEGEGEAPPPPPAQQPKQSQPNPVQQLGAAAWQANQNAPPEIQQDILLLTTIAERFPPGTEATMPPEVVQAENEARMRIKTWKARASQPGIGGAGEQATPQLPPQINPIANPPLPQRKAIPSLGF